MTKIVHLTSSHPATDVRILQKQCRALAAAGYEVVLVAPAGEMPVDVPDVRVRCVPRAACRLGRLLRTPRRVCRAALRENADLYHLHDPELLPFARRLRQNNRRVVFDMHENLPKDLLHKRWIPRPLRRAAAWVAARALRRWLGSVPVVFAEDSYAADFPWVGDSCVVRNMPPLESLSAVARQCRQHSDQHQHEPHRASIGYLGVLDAEHGSLVTLEALGQLAAEGFELTLECVGPVRPRHERLLRRRAARLGLTGIRLHGYLPPVEAWRRIAPCRAGLALLAAKPNLVDSYPTKLFEYMALGIPVIASDFPLYRAVVERAGCGYCVAPDDPAAVARGLRRLLTRPDESLVLGCRGQQAVQRHFHWQREAATLLDFYGRLLPPEPPTEKDRHATESSTRRAA